jgi:hypothetical protein
MNDPEKSKPSQKNLIIVLALTGLAFLFAAYQSLSDREPSKRPLTDREKCAGLSGPDCFEKLERERRWQELAESESGKNLMRAADATEK